MKSLSIRQPWASMIASGQKTIETRTWPTKYRGPLLICAGVSYAVDFSPPPKEDRHLFPLGQALCIVEVTDCRPMVKADEPEACCEIYPEAWAWVLGNVQKIEPFPVKGALGLFNVEVPDLVHHRATEIAEVL